MEVDGLADSITTNAAGFITTRGLYTHSLTNEQISIANWNQNIGNNPFTTLRVLTTRVEPYLNIEQQYEYISRSVKSM